MSNDAPLTYRVLSAARGIAGAYRIVTDQTVAEAAPGVLYRALYVERVSATEPTMPAPVVV